MQVISDIFKRMLRYKAEFFIRGNLGKNVTPIFVDVISNPENMLFNPDEEPEIDRALIEAGFEPTILRGEYRYKDLFRPDDDQIRKGLGETNFSHLQFHDFIVTQRRLDVSNNNKHFFLEMVLTPKKKKAITADLLHRMKELNEKKTQEEHDLYDQMDAWQRTQRMAYDLDLKIEKQRLNTNGFRVQNIYIVYKRINDRDYEQLAVFQSSQEAMRYLINYKKQEDRRVDEAADLNSHMTEREREDAS